MIGRRELVKRLMVAPLVAGLGIKMSPPGPLAELSYPPSPDETAWDMLVKAVPGDIFWIGDGEEPDFRYRLTRLALFNGDTQPFALTADFMGYPPVFPRSGDEGVRLTNPYAGWKMEDRISPSLSTMGQRTFHITLERPEADRG